MNLSEQLARLGSVKEHEPLAFHTTYKIGGKADFFIEVASLENLKKLIQLLNENDIDWLVLGNGSNVLIDDCAYHGVVISLKGAFDAFHFEEGILSAQAGCSMIKLSFEAMNHSLSGLEFASGIPGSLGGGIYMNAGAYRSDLSEILIDVTILRNGKVETLPKADLNFTYRHSLFQKHKDWIILSARFGLQPKEKTEIKALMDSRKQRRLSTQPVSRPSAGSVFRNPHGMNAWQVVDNLGYRGKAIGQARVSEVHSNFIVNEGNASARDVDRLIRMIQKDAWEKLGIRLITEVERINWHAETDTLFIA
ncbi:UDP-N-acetylmuramate dehydrogenase [Erysipelotrichaceae bacterium RD49]|nr:UDP-N-acetylmuramate dehydrogenase [Erysipelotrichaceae bacterium RD49]